MPYGMRNRAAGARKVMPRKSKRMGTSPSGRTRSMGTKTMSTKGRGMSAKGKAMSTKGRGMRATKMAARTRPARRPVAAKKGMSRRRYA